MSGLRSRAIFGQADEWKQCTDGKLRLSALVELLPKQYRCSGTFTIMARPLPWSSTAAAKANLVSRYSGHGGLSSSVGSSRQPFLDRRCFDCGELAHFTRDFHRFRAGSRFNKFRPPGF
ncbi:hypothetical protein HAX54_019562 [Datura stramonium]|uniref:CCHC-type domain-containing protein n=1 Tax=Datura stramonium TaxID=4076 RepID=A0ABS8US91_DATST|nr:hypothetical protein [Datura stramonium]